jgi:hypothetical protein
MSRCPFGASISFSAHFNGRIGFIFAETIQLAIYLESWTLVMLVIIFKFLLDSHSFLLEAIGMNSWKKGKRGVKSGIKNSINWKRSTKSGENNSYERGEISSKKKKHIIKRIERF